MAPRTFIVPASVLASFFLAGSGWSAATSAPTAASAAPGDLVRMTRGETLLLNNKNFASAAKGEEFTVLQNDAAQKLVSLEYYKKDGSRVAVTAPSEAVEPAPAEGWSDLLRGVEAFRDGRYEASRALLVRAQQDAKYKPLAAAIAPRLMGATALPNATTLTGLRDLAFALCKDGQISLGLPVDQGADRLAARLTSAPPTKLDKDDVVKRAAAVTRAAAFARQNYAQHKTREAAANVKEGLQLEPKRPDLLAMEKKFAKDLSEADDRLADADRMRKIPKGEVHALTALQLGLKLAVDHPGLVALKAEMQGALEERTAPPITPALLSAARAKSPIATLEEGRKLYTTRCTECHDLEMIDSRSASGWERMVGGMARRAGLNGEQQARIMEYITVALNATP